MLGRSWVGIGVAAAVLLAPLQPSCARPPVGDVVKQVEALALEARRAYQDGRYEDAIQFYLEAYRLEPAAALLYNIAYVYDKKLSELELGLDFYRRYIRAPDAEPDVVGRATARIGEIKKELEGRVKEPPVKPPVLLDTPVRPVPAPARPEPAVPVVTKPAGVDPQKVWGYATLGTGIASLSTGVVLGFVAQKTNGDFRESLMLSEKQDLRSAGRAEAIAADVLMGVGAAAIVTGAVLLLTTRRSDPTGSKAGGPGLRVGATAAPGGALLLLGGSL